MAELNKMVGFVTTTRPEEAIAFYRDKLGFTFRRNDGFALVFDAYGTILRVGKAKKFKAVPIRFSAGKYQTSMQQRHCWHSVGSRSSAFLACPRAKTGSGSLPRAIRWHCSRIPRKMCCRSHRIQFHSETPQRSRISRAITHCGYDLRQFPLTIASVFETMHGHWDLTFDPCECCPMPHVHPHRVEESPNNFAC
jgi:hypothetical protein